MARVSIIMAAYEAAGFIDEAIGSVLAQTHTDWELIVIDDCSRDGTAEHVAARYRSEPRILCRRLGANAGPGAARNLGMSLARGEWISILDSDDQYRPERLERLLAAAEADSLDLVADNQHYLDGTAGQIFQTGFVLSRPSVPLTLELLLMNDGPPLRFSFGALKPFLRRSFVRENLLSYPEDLRVGEDFVFLFNALQSGARACVIAEPYYVYTVPTIRARPSSEKTRTNYGAGNIESLLDANAMLLATVEATAPGERRLIDLLRLRQRRLHCALALRESAALRGTEAARRILRERAWNVFLADKARNVFQRSHVVRGVG